MIYYAIIMTALSALLLGFICGYMVTNKKPSKHSGSFKATRYSSQTNDEYRNFLNYNGGEQA